MPRTRRADLRYDPSPLVSTFLDRQGVYLPRRPPEPLASVCGAVCDYSFLSARYSLRPGLPVHHTKTNTLLRVLIPWVSLPHLGSGGPDPPSGRHPHAEGTTPYFYKRLISLHYTRVENSYTILGLCTCGALRRTTRSTRGVGDPLFVCSHTQVTTISRMERHVLHVPSPPTPPSPTNPLDKKMSQNDTWPLARFFISDKNLQ